MKFKKMLSFVLSLVIIFGTMAGFTTVSAAVTGDGFENLAVNGDFSNTDIFFAEQDNGTGNYHLKMKNENNESVAVWKISSNASGSLAIVDDKRDSSNKVLRYIGTGGNISYISYAKDIDSSKKYYASIKVRVADTHDEENDKDKNGNSVDNLYLYGSSLNGFTGNDAVTKPKIVKGEWATCSGVFTNKSSFAFKVTATQASSSDVPKVIYEVDDFVLYDVTNSKAITLPEGAEIVSGAFKSNGNLTGKYVEKIYANPGATVVLRYDDTKSILVSENAEIKNTAEATYSFTMPNADVTVGLGEAPAFTNLVVNGDMEDENTIKWKIGSNAKGGVISIETDTENPENSVLRFDGTGIKSKEEDSENGNDKPMSYMSYGYGLEEGKNYYYSYKIRLVQGESDTGNIYAFNNLIQEYGAMGMPELTGSNMGKWQTRSGKLTAGSASGFNFKMIDARSDSNNVPNVIFELDDVVIYDLDKLDDLDEITLPKDVSLEEGAKAALSYTNKDLTTTTKYLAKAGDEVVLTYKKANNILVSENAEIKNTAEATYSFTMPNADVTVGLVKVPAFTNLVVNGDMEDENTIKWNPASNAKGAKISIETDTENPENSVLRFDGTGIKSKTEDSENGNDKPMSYMSYGYGLDAGTYYYSYKIRKTADEVNKGTFYAYNSNLNRTNHLDRPQLSTTWETRSGIFTAAADTTFNFKMVNNLTSATKPEDNVYNVIYEIDDVVVYDFADIHEIEMPSNAKINEGGKKLNIYSLVSTTDDENNTTYRIVATPKGFAEAGDEVNVEYTGENILNAEGADVTADGNIFTFTMPEGDVKFTEQKHFEFDEATTSIKVAIPRSFNLIAAKYNGKVLTEAYTTRCETTENNEVVSLKGIDEFSKITDWANVHIFVLNSLTDLTPLSNYFVCAQ